MGFLKKNLYWLVFGLVVIASVTILVMASGMAGKNTAEKDRAMRVVDGVTRMRGDASKVNVTLYNHAMKNGELAKLDAQEVTALAGLSTLRPYLYDTSDIFPAVRELAQVKFHYTNFAEAYVDLLDKMLEHMHAQDRPSYAEEERMITEYKSTSDVETGGSSRGRSRRTPTRTPTRAPTLRAAGGPMMGGPDMGMGGPGMMGPGMMGPGMMGGPGMGMGAPVGGGSRSTRRVDMDVQAQRLVEDLRRRRAEEISVYAGVNVFCAFEYWDAKTVQQPNMMLKFSWFTQLAAWIQEDVALSIAAVNGDSEKVADSPVKRLVEVTFVGDPVVAGTGGAMATMGGMGAGMGAGGRDTVEQLVGRRDPARKDMLPCYVIKFGEDDPATGEVTAAHTEHVCNDLYDVIHFETAVVIEEEAITKFMQTLQGEKKINLLDPDTEARTRNPITILQMHIEPVNLAIEEEAGYYYGGGSLCALRLVCEYVIYKHQEAYEDLKPDPVKDMFEEE